MSNYHSHDSQCDVLAFKCLTIQAENINYITIQFYLFLVISSRPRELKEEEECLLVLANKFVKSHF